MMKRTFALLLALVMAFALCACNNQPADNSAPADSGAPSEAPGESETPSDAPAAYTGIDWEALAAMDPDEADETIYDFALGEYGAAYAAAKEQPGGSATRLAMYAQAEAKMLEAGVFLPVITNGGAFSMGRVVPRTNAATILWGLDSYRYHTLLITNEIIKAEDRAELLKMWSAAEDADAYHQQAREYLEGKGYTFKDSYNLSNGYNVNIWDVIATSYTSDSFFIAGTYDSLLEYDCKGELQPGLAESYEVSDDGTVYTFHIRQGVQWVDHQGSPIGEVTADDWVASMAHVADNNDALGYLMSADGGCGIKNYDAYLGGEVGFDEVGVKAVDDYTLEYTLEAPFTPFTTMMGYGCFAPLNRAFYQSQGGTFSADGVEYTPGDYGKTPSNIAYCGPYLITSFTAQNATKYEANPTYWNADAVNIKSVTWTYNDNTDVTRSYEEAKSGVIDGAGVTVANLEKAKTEKLEGDEGTIMDTYCYVSEGDGTTFCGWMNLNRGVWTNYDDPSIGASPKSEEEQTRAKNAMVNQNFRLALLMSFDRGAYNACTVGEDLKYNRLRNAYVPGTFQFLDEDVTIDINGTETTFPAGTAYGEIEQAQLDADGYPIKVWNEETSSGDGFDGWYNPDNAKEYLQKAIEELGQIGVEVSPEKPIYVDYPYLSSDELSTNEANVLKQSIEASLEGNVVINLVAFDTQTDYEGATYRFSAGSEANFDLSTGSGWGPDYGDAQTYLDTIQAYGYMCKNIGLF